MSGKNYVTTKSTNSLLVRTQGLLTEMANFAQEVELQWGIEEKTRADSALRVIDTVLFDNGITWSEVINDEQRRNNIVSVVKQIVFLKLNPDAIPREVYFMVRNKRVGVDQYNKPIWKKFIESGVEGAGNDSLLRNFGEKVKNVKFYIVYEGDEFSGVWYDGFDVKLPTFRPKKRAVGEAKGKALYAVYLIEKTDGTFDVSIAEREDVKQSLLAAIRQNGNDKNNSNAMEEYIAKLSKYSLDDILDGKVSVGEFRKKNEFWNPQTRRYDTSFENLTLQDMISPAWRSVVSREKMIERKMRNHATRPYPKKFSHVEIQKIYEATFEEENYSNNLEFTPTNLVDMNENEETFNKASGSIELDENESVDLTPEFDDIDNIDETEIEDNFDEVLDFVGNETDVEVENEAVVEAETVVKPPENQKQEPLTDDLPDWMRLD